MWIVVKHLWDCLRSIVHTVNWSGISVESCTRFQNQGITGQPLGYYNDEAIALPEDFNHPVKESRRRVSISSETRPVYV